MVDAEKNQDRKKAPPQQPAIIVAEHRNAIHREAVRQRGGCIRGAAAGGIQGHLRDLREPNGNADNGERQNRPPPIPSITDSRRESRLLFQKQQIVVVFLENRPIFTPYNV